MAQGRPRPFLDSNVLFSAFHGSGPPAQILERHIEGLLIIVISRQVLEEVIRTIERKQPAMLPALLVFLSSAPPEIGGPPTPSASALAESCINAKDAPILATALTSRADCVVSGNTRHFTQAVAECAGIAITTPAEYLVSLYHNPH